MSFKARDAAKKRHEERVSQAVNPKRWQPVRRPQPAGARAAAAEAGTDAFTAAYNELTAEEVVTALEAGQYSREVVSQLENARAGGPRKTVLKVLEE